MNAGEIIRKIIKGSGLTQAKLAMLLGYKGQTSVAERLNKDMRTSVFAKMCDAIGYEIYIVPKSRGGNVAFKKEDAIKLTSQPEQS